nr:MULTISPECIES: acyltransferase [unclassified Paenibacillus]
MDYLRGMLAFSVMVYHYTSWINMSLFYPLDQLISRLGIYAVPSFYILSGISLGLVYAHRDVNTAFLAEFVTKRIFRIVPLFYAATTLIIFVRYQIYAKVPSLETILENYLFIFPWASPANSIITGGWSIGNEIVFYAFLPFLLLIKQRSKKFFALIVIFIFIIGIGFSFFILDESLPLAEQWNVYVNPLNQLFYFVGGVLLGLIFLRNIHIKNELILLGIGLSVLFIAFVPVNGDDKIVLVTGFQRILFTLFIFLLCGFVAFWRSGLNKITSVFKFFGNISYSLYLIHPILFNVTFALLKPPFLKTDIQKMVFSMVITVILSTISYYFFEKTMIRFGRAGVERFLTSKQKSLISG